MTNDIKAAAERLRLWNETASFQECPEYDNRGKNEGPSDAANGLVNHFRDAGIVAEAYLEIINRSPSEAARAAATDVNDWLVNQRGVGEFLTRMDDDKYAVFEKELLSIIQRHIPPVNERLLEAAKAVYAQIGNHAPAIKRHAVTPGARDGLRDAIAEARAALEGK